MQPSQALSNLPLVASVAYPCSSNRGGDSRIKFEQQVLPCRVHWLELMKWKTFVIGWVFALAILLMAQRRSAVSENAAFKNIVDLTHSVSETSSNSQGHLQSVESREYFATHLDAPAHSLTGMW